MTPTFSSGRAQIVTKNPAGGVLGTFDVRQVAGRATEVAYRSIYGGPDTDAGGGAREHRRSLRTALTRRSSE